MVSLFKKLLGDHSAKTVKRHQKTVAIINSFEPDMQKLSDEELGRKTVEFRARLEKGETLEDQLPEAFAVVREASLRVTGKRHYDVQLIGGMVLHEGNIAEMRTGEGKTLVATLPAYLNALAGKGVHVITVNDYLARRDAEEMGRIYSFLGMTTGLTVHGLTPAERKVSYGADITYGTNNEFGFDYLRDNMVHTVEEMVQRPHYFAIVDEVDSILVDEARTPLIISGPGDKPTDMYYTMAKLVERMEPEVDFNVEEKDRRVMPTEEGVRKVEKWLGVDHLYEGENMQLAHYLTQALKAKTLFFLDRDYVVKDGEVIIVDEFTGRLMFGRRYSEGLHQAIEAKEDVKIENESITYATITFQNYFRMYEKLSGMTGTALTEEDEFREIYTLDVIVIPTNKPMVRKDHPDVVYKTTKAKYTAVVEDIEERHKKGQPVLVGTVSIEKSEVLSALLQRKGVKHQVLNAKYHEKEAEIVAQAGRFNSVTIATNMAGRGTDILLGGNPEALAKDRLRAKGVTQEVALAAFTGLPTEDEEVLQARATYKQLLEESRQLCEAEAQKVREAGGLVIIGTERHESRRIDNQLRGRAGRQGDPGESRFYVALDDDLMRLFGGDRVSALMDRLGMEEDTPIDATLVSRAIENAQKKVEARNFDIRKHVLRYDDVMNKQREIIYGERRQVLAGEGTRQIVMDGVQVLVKSLVDEACPEGVHEDDWDRSVLVTLLEQNLLPQGAIQVEDLEDAGKDGMTQTIIEKAEAFYAEKEERLGEELMRQLEQYVILRTVDAKWIDHLDGMDDLREGIGLRAYGQEDPLVVYQREAYEVFNGMTMAIQEEVVKAVFHLEIARAPEPAPKRQLVESGGSVEPPAKPVAKAKEAGRNDPCPCGSGKKYKHCHGAE